MVQGRITSTTRSRVSRAAPTGIRTALSATPATWVVRVSGCLAWACVRRLAAVRAVVLRRRAVWRSADEPITVVAVDSAEKIEKALPYLDQMVVSGLVAISDADVILYRETT